MTTLISAIYGGYDRPKPLPPDHGFDQAILVTDRPAFVDGWQVVVESPPPGQDPRLGAKRPKCVPWEYTDDDRSVWVDGSFEVLPGFRDVVDDHLERGDLVTWRHPSGRLDAFEEAEFSCRYEKYFPVVGDLRAQAAHYADAGLPKASGLWEVPMIARRHTDEVRGFGQMWLDECHRWTVQDQVSFAYCVWALGLQVTPWAGHSHWTCGWVRRHSHRDGT